MNLITKIPTLISSSTRVIVQGITGNQGKFHTKSMLGSGTVIVAGTSPGKGGELVEGIPVYDSIKDAQRQHELNASIIFIPASGVLAAAYEAMDAGLSLVVIITEHVPVWDVGLIITRANRENVTIVGPNCPGLISPLIGKMGIIPSNICLSGEVGIVSRSGTLTYEILSQLSSVHIGQSMCVGIGGDPLHGIGFCECLAFFEADSQTKAIVLIGEIGGSEEETAADYIRSYVHKPVIVFLAGRTAPRGKKMGHAGALISGKSGSIENKLSVFEHNNIPVARHPKEIITFLQKL